MKRNGVRLLSLLLSALLVGGVLVSCDEWEIPTPESKTEESGERPSKTTERSEEPTKKSEETEPEDSDSEPIIEGPYRIDYLCDFPYEGNCTARLYLNPSYTEDFTVEIPANSPDGKLITHFNVWNNFFVGDCVPKIISEKTYQEAIMKPLKEACERGEIEEFYVRKIDSYFQLKNPLKMKKYKDKEECIKQYPITDPNGANVPIYVFSSDASDTEILKIQNYLNKYTSFSKEIIKADYAYLQDAIRKSPLSETRKAKLLSKYQYSDNEHFVELTLPDTLRWVEAQNLTGCEKAVQTENGISYIGNWVVRTDNSLTSIVLRDGTVGIANRAISNENLKSITIPASLKTICGSIVYDRFSVRSFRELHISNLAAWCAVRCIDYNDSRLPPFNTAYDLYLNGELLTDLVIPDGVTNIGFGAFSGCNSLTSITLPFVGANADGTGEIDFKNIFGDSVPASLKTVVITGGTSIGESAFERCTGLTSITIPGSVTSIGNSAFERCTDLASITIPNSVTSIGDSAFSGCTGLTSITIPDSVTSIVGAFSGCTGLTSIIIPNSVTSIGDFAFHNCTGLTSITIPDSVASIGDYAFHNCTGLTSITIPDSVASIGDYAFLNCTCLMSITIGNSVTSIGSGAFFRCYKLVEVYNKSALPIWEYGDVGYYAKAIYTEPYTSKLSVDQNGYILYTDGDLVSLIGYIGNVTDLTLPSGIAEINHGAFSGCTGLTSITIPDSVTSIGSWVFSDCTGLTSITISNSVTSIGSKAFSGCTDLTSITYKGTQAQWNEISKSSLGWSGTVICSDETITV